MKKINKKIMIMVLIIVIILLVIVIKVNGSNKNNQITDAQILFQTMQDGTKVNTSSEFNKIKMIENIEIKNSQLINKNGITRLIAE